MPHVPHHASLVPCLCSALVLHVRCLRLARAPPVLCPCPACVVPVSYLHPGARLDPLGRAVAHPGAPWAIRASMDPSGSLAAHPGTPEHIRGSRRISGPVWAPWGARWLV